MNGGKSNEWVLLGIGGFKDLRKGGSEMGIMTAKEYLESVEDVRPTVYIHGELARDQ